MNSPKPKPHSLNPGLLFYNYYFSVESRAVPPIAEHGRELGEYVGINPDNDNFGVADLFERNPSDDQKRAAKFHFQVRNDLLFGKYDLNDLPESNARRQTRLDDRAFSLTTTYPGLLVGLGYNHQVSSERAINLGFAFDHTTGLPYLPGSSVKGAIRAAFPNRDLTRAKKANGGAIDYGSIARAKLSWLTETTGLDSSQLGQLEDILFESQLQSGNGWRYLPISQRAIFHDALLTATDSDGRIFGPDSITPHISRRKEKIVPDIYVEPTPIGLMKVLPGVKFTFAFTLAADLPLWDVAPEFTAESVQQLFRKILIAYGIGAKSRVGYGRFAEEMIDLPDEKEIGKMRKAFEDPDFRGIQSNTKNEQKRTRPGKSVRQVEAVVERVSKDQIDLLFADNHRRYFDLSRPEHGDLIGALPGDRYSVGVKSTFDNGKVQYITSPIYKIS